MRHPARRIFAFDRGRSPAAAEASDSARRIVTFDTTTVAIS